MKAQTRRRGVWGGLLSGLLALALLAASCSDATENSVSAPTATATDNTASSTTDSTEDIASDSESTPPGDTEPSDASPAATEQPTAPAETNPPTTTVSLTTTATTLPPVTPNFEPDEFDFSVAVGSSHACLLSQGGTVRCWGSNRWGQLGNGETADVPLGSESLIYVSSIADIEPPCDDCSTIDQVARGSAIVSGIENVIEIASGFDHTCALRIDGTVWCWGRNNFGQLGNGKLGEEEYLSEPNMVQGITDATALAASGNHSCVLREDSSMSCWGANDDGQLGRESSESFSNGDSTQSYPSEVVGVDDVIQMALGDSHSCALLSDGRVSCWGNIQISVSQLEDVSDVKSIVAGSNHTCALHIDGSVTCWGENTYGQVDGLFYMPPGDPEFRSDFAKPEVDYAYDIVAGFRHTCVLLSYGSVECWGDDDWNGRLGNGISLFGEPPYVLSDYLYDIDNPFAAIRESSIDLPSGFPPESVFGISDAKAIYAFGNQTCVITENDSILCWGDDTLYGLEEDRVLSSSIPIKSNGITNAISVAAGLDHTCALREDGTVMCWGNSREGKLGNPISVALGETPVTARRIEGATSISSNSEFTCALHQSGNISCWGINPFGQLGNGVWGIAEFSPVAISEEPVYVESIVDAVQVSSGNNHTCALDTENSVFCWGLNAFGQLGNGEYDAERRLWEYSIETQPVKVIGIQDVDVVAAGRDHTCALHKDGTISCWGRDGYGQIGAGSPDDLFEEDPSFLTTPIISAPTKVTGVNDAIAIALGEDHSCAVHVDGTVSCWGKNRSGQLGDGGFMSSNIPKEVAGIDDAIAVDAGKEHTCALHSDGTISCWGSSKSGKLGNGEIKYRLGEYGGGRIKDEGYIIANEALMPVKVVGITDAIAISAGGEHTCAVHEDRTVSCWGDNMGGQLGDGSPTSFALPVEFTIPPAG